MIFVNILHFLFFFENPLSDEIFLCIQAPGIQY